MNSPAILNKNLVVLARVLERLERSAVPVDAEQYRSVVNHLASELSVARHDASLEAVLQACPAVAQLYENLHYAQSGLCRSRAPESLAALMETMDILGSVRRTARPG